MPTTRLADIEHVRAYLQQTAHDFEAAVRAHRRQAGDETLLLLCARPTARARRPRAFSSARPKTILAASLAPVPGLQVVSASQFHQHYGVDEDAVHDALRDDIAHIPYRDDYLHVLAAIVARHVYRRLAPARKVVVVDCDNTLWRGVVGEVGAEGVEFDDGHRALHAHAARLTESGVLVCLCSKNEEPDVWRVFETRADFGLAATTSSRPRSTGCRSRRTSATLAARLNLGLDSFVFIDDNPVECAEVRAGCPEVLTVQWPQDAERAIALTRHFWEFDGGKATSEDARRTALYKEEFQRQEARAGTLTFEDFIKSLQLEVDFAPLSHEDVRRAAQLTLRTNQFNFTTIRRDEAEVQALAAGGRHEIRTVRVRDRFGDYGLVGLVIAERGDESWDLDTFLLSCRVLGRGVEHRIVSDLGQMAAAAGARSVLDARRDDQAEHARAVVLRVGRPVGVPRGRRACASRPTCPARRAGRRPLRAGDGRRGRQFRKRAARKPPPTPLDASHLRRREAQIARTAFELATGPPMRAAAEGGAQRSRPVSSAGRVTAGERDVAAIVHAAFASALRVSAERWRSVDQLEALGLRLAAHRRDHRRAERALSVAAQHAALRAPRRQPDRREIVRLSQPQLASLTPPTATARVEAVAVTADIAIVGIGVRCAGADSPDQLWTLLRDGRSAVKAVPPDRLYFLRALADERPHWAGLLDHVAANARKASVRSALRGSDSA